MSQYILFLYHRNAHSIGCFCFFNRMCVDGCHSEPDAEILNSAGGGMGVYAHGKYAGAGYTRLEYAVPATQGGGKKSRRKNKQNR